MLLHYRQKRYIHPRVRVQIQYQIYLINHISFENILLIFRHISILFKQLFEQRKYRLWSDYVNNLLEFADELLLANA